MGASGGPITKDQTGVETYATIFALAPSYHDANVLWSGSDDGYVFVTRNASAANPTWENVTPKDAPDFVRINTIEASPTTPGKAYVAGIRYLVDNDRHPYIWKTTDYGKTWTHIDQNGIPENDFVRAVREDPTRAGLLYAASETTVYVSWDDGAHWQRLAMDLPNTQVSDIVVKDHDLVIATHGRSFWVMHNIDLLRQMSPEVAAADVWLFDPKDPVQEFDRTADVFYYLKDDADKVTVEFLDDAGNVVQSFESAEGEEEPAEQEGGGGLLRLRRLAEALQDEGLQPLPLEHARRGVEGLRGPHLLGRRQSRARGGARTLPGASDRRRRREDAGLRDPDQSARGGRGRYRGRPAPAAGPRGARSGTA